MKKSGILLLMILLMAFPNTILAVEKAPVNKTATTEIPADVKVMLNRLDEIKDMDKSSLNSTDRKELRKEVREIKSTLRSSGNGLYISTGAIIIILLLIIIL